MVLAVEEGVRVASPLAMRFLVFAALFGLLFVSF